MAGVAVVVHTLGTLEPQQAQRIERDQRCSAGIGQNRDPQARHAEHGGDQKQALEAKCNTDSKLECEPCQPITTAVSLWQP